MRSPAGRGERTAGGTQQTGEAVRYRAAARKPVITSCVRVSSQHLLQDSGSERPGCHRKAEVSPTSELGPDRDVATPVGLSRDVVPPLSWSPAHRVLGRGLSPTDSHHHSLVNSPKRLLTVN